MKKNPALALASSSSVREMKPMTKNGSAGSGSGISKGGIPISERNGDLPYVNGKGKSQSPDRFPSPPPSLKYPPVTENIPVVSPTTISVNDSPVNFSLFCYKQLIAEAYTEFLKKEQGMGGGTWREWGTSKRLT